MQQRLFIRAGLVAAASAAAASGAFGAGLVNGSFEQLNVAMPANYIQTDASNVPGWKTTASNNQIEIWRAPGPDATPTPADDGNRFAELNATEPSTLYQDVPGIAANAVVGWKLSHRGRDGTDTMRLTITDLGLDGVFGTPDDSMLFSRSFSDGLSWGHYTGTNIIAKGNTVRFAFEAVGTASIHPVDGSPWLSKGNFLDAADFGVGVGAVPEPGTWAMFIAGAMAMASIARRSRRG